VYLAGHDHNLQALQPQLGVRFYIAGGGGAGLYEVKPDARTLFASSANGFAILDADANRLTIRLVDTNGQAVYEEVITKASTTIAPGQTDKH
jgi:tartrate-resistant acid phosphatase type 5